MNTLELCRKLNPHTAAIARDIDRLDIELKTLEDNAASLLAQLRNADSNTKNFDELSEKYYRAKTVRNNALDTWRNLRGILATHAIKFGILS